MSSPRFIVGTGRCGSTLLSSLLATHPSVLGVSELFSALGSRRFPEGTLTGSQLWAMLSEPVPAWTLALQRRLEPAEFLYPVDAGGRFDRRTGVPPIAAVCLPALTSEPDALYGKLEDVVPRLPAGRFGDVVGALLDWLAAQFDRTMWIERSGGSLAYAGGLASHFKDARFVHLHRSGPETALSMSRHPFFLMDVSRGFESLDPGALQPGAVSAERFAIRWSATILQGTSQLATLPRDRVYHAAYEDLLSAPRTALRDLLAFLDLPDVPANWFDRAAETVRPRGLAAPDLPHAMRERLQRACEPGQRRLASTMTTGA